MKTISTDLRTHLDQDVTALCTCWVITRVDGSIFRFTDADEDVTQGGDTYKSIGAYKRTAIETTSSLSVDNLDIMGSASDLALPETDLRAGLFDNAEIKIFITPWLDTVRGQLKMRRGFFGEVQTLPNGTFQVELRGLMQRLSYNYMDIFSATCLYDLGSPQCGIPIRPDEVSATTYAVGEFVNVQQTGTIRGEIFNLAIGDPDFEIAGAATNGIADSLYWFNVGANAMLIDSTDFYTGSYSLRGGAGDGEVQQYVDLTELGTGLTFAALDAAACYMTLRGWRRDVSDRGRVRTQFIDDSGNDLSYGLQADWNTSAIPVTLLSIAGDFTIEFWVNMEGTIDASDGPCSDGTNTFPGAGNDINFFDGFPRLLTNLAAASATDRIVSPNALVAGTWTHLAFVREGDDLRIYENFELVIEELTTGYVANFDISQIGGTTNGGALTAQMMEFRIWDTARSQFELTFYGDRSIDPATADLLRYYSFYDGTYDDQTGNDAVPAVPGPNLTIAATGPVAVAQIHRPVGDALLTTGLVDVGTTWTEFEFVDALVPIGSRYARLRFDGVMDTAPELNSFLDNLTGYIIDTTQAGSQNCHLWGDVMWECTTAGTGGTGVTTGDGVGDSTAHGGTAIFLGVEAWTRMGRVISVTDAREFTAVVADPRAVEAWFNGGLVTFETGVNSGASMEVKSWDPVTGIIELFLSMPSAISAGDLFCVYPGCDKSRISCAAIFNNTVNMFATPDVPGQDELLRYPDQK